MYDSITPPEWYRNVIFGVLAHGLIGERPALSPKERGPWGLEFHLNAWVAGERHCESKVSCPTQCPRLALEP